MKDITVEYKHGFNKIDNHEMPLKGYRNDILVKCPTGKMYNLFFYDHVRLAQDIGCKKHFVERRNSNHLNSQT